MARKKEKKVTYSNLRLDGHLWIIKCHEMDNFFPTSKLWNLLKNQDLDYNNKQWGGGGA